MATKRSLPGIRRRRSEAKSVFVALVVLFITLLSICVVVFDGRMRLMLLSLDGACICGVIFLIMSEVAPDYFLPRVLTIVYAMQCVLLFLVGWLQLDMHSDTHVPDLAQFPYGAVLPQLIPPVTALAVLAVWRRFQVPVRRQSLWKLSSVPPRGLEAYLVGGALVSLLYWPAAREGSTGFISYGLRILQHAVAIMPLLVGFYRQRLRNVDLLWITVLTINFGIGLLTGSRSLAIIPVLLYLVGYLLSAPPRRRVYKALMVLVSTVPLAMIGGAVGNVRDTLGRGSISLLSIQRAKDVSNGVWQILSADAQTAREVTSVSGIGRAVPWPTLAVTTQTPEFTPYRGFDGFGSEIVQSLQIYSLGSKSRADINDQGLFNFPATLYGYTVDSGTSVEWGVIADAWSRGGMVATFFFSFVLSVLSIGAEYVLRVKMKGRSASLLMFCILISAQMSFSTSPALYIVRQTVLDILLITVVSFAVERLGPWTRTRSALRMHVIADR